MNRPSVRASLASVAIVAAATALAGCNSDSIIPTGRAQAPLSEKMLAEISAKNMDKEAPILARIFKEESEMEIWKQNRDGQFALLKTYPICRWSGDLGPKKKQGDRQAPEGFYTITPGQMNPNSKYYLAFNTGFPNSYDRAMGYTGSDLMVHGDCSSRGCYAMTDEQIQEIYALARESFFGGQKSFQLQAYPFRMTALNMTKHRNNPNFAFWKMIKEGYDHFEATLQEPKVAVCERRYVFDAVAPASASKLLAFDAQGTCPVFEIDPTIADAALDRRRQEQRRMADYIARDIPMVPSRNGIDGGMNTAFADKVGIDNGQVYLRAGNAVLPGALPRESNPPAPTAMAASHTSQPLVMATPQTASQPKSGAPESKLATLGSTHNGVAAQPRPPARTASGATIPAHKPHEAEPSTDVAPNNAPPPSPSPVQQAGDSQKTVTAKPDLRSAYSTTAVSDIGLLTGTQPMVPASSFESRWSPLR